MSDVEFLEPDRADEKQDDPPASPSGLRARSAVVTVVTVVTVVAAVVGAALAVLAPFTMVYRVRLTGLEGEVGTGYRLDGWGRYGGDANDAGQHGLRLGIVLCVTAGLVVLGLVLWLVSQRRTERSRRYRSAGGGVLVFAAGTALATAAVSLLGGLAAVDSYRAALRAAGVGAAGDGLPRPTVHLELGPVTWLGLASAVLLIAAALAATFTRRGLPERDPMERDWSDRDAATEQPAPLHHDDELLG